MSGVNPGNWGNAMRRVGGGGVRRHRGNAAIGEMEGTPVTASLSLFVWGALDLHVIGGFKKKNETSAPKTKTKKTSLRSGDDMK